MRTINIGIIGWGFMGRTHAHGARSIRLFYPNCGFNVNIKGICSRRLEIARQAAGEMGADYYTDDYNELLKRSDIDVVSICSPNELHEEMAVAAIKAGKHVYIDKPLAHNYESAKRIADAAEISNVKTMMVFNNRYLPATIRAKQLVDEGKIGDILTFGARYLHSGSIDPNKPIGWKQTRQGGVLNDLGTHALDLLTWLIGYPDEVFCTARTLYGQRPDKSGNVTSELGEDHAVMTMKLPGGAVGFMECGKISTGANDELSFEVRGTKGAIKFDLMQPNYLQFFDNTLPEAPYGGTRGFTAIESVARYPSPGGTFLPPKNTIGWDRGHMHCYYTFLEAVANDRPIENTVKDGARLQKLVDTALRSCESGRTERFDG